MCLIALGWRAHPTLPLVVAANRDEWRERPTLPASWWGDHPDLLAGRDLQAGGSWMGITRQGRFAAITNFRDPSDKRSTAMSRGGLVTEFLSATTTPQVFLATLGRRVPDYNGFNLIVGDGKSLCSFSSRHGIAQVIEPGVHALSNHNLDEPWPKVRRAKEAMVSALGESDPRGRLFAMLGNDSRAEDAELPQTGVGLDWERRLSPVLITGAEYGTRSSTVLTVASNGSVQFEERMRDAAGGVSGTKAFEFRS